MGCIELCGNVHTAEIHPKQINFWFCPNFPNLLVFVSVSVSLSASVSGDVNSPLKANLSSTDQSFLWFKRIEKTTTFIPAMTTMLSVSTEAERISWFMNIIWLRASCAAAATLLVSYSNASKDRWAANALSTTSWGACQKKGMNIFSDGLLGISVPTFSN